MKIQIEGINGGQPFEIPEITLGDEEARLKAIIDYKKAHRSELDIPETEQAAMQHGLYAMWESIFKRVDESVTTEVIRKIPLSKLEEIGNAAFEQVGTTGEGGDGGPK